jgi:hypothetical protein
LNSTDPPIEQRQKTMAKNIMRNPFESLTGSDLMNLMPEFLSKSELVPVVIRGQALLGKIGAYMRDEADTIKLTKEVYDTIASMNPILSLTREWIELASERHLVELVVRIQDIIKTSLNKPGCR